MSGFPPSGLVWYRGFLSQVHDLSTAPGRVGFSKQYLLLLLLLMEFIDGSMMSRAGCGRMKAPCCRGGVIPSCLSHLGQGGARPMSCVSESKSRAALLRCCPPVGGQGLSPS